MDSLLNNPAIQAGILPFLATVILSRALPVMGGYRTTIAVFAGFFVAVYFTVGFNLFPLSSTRKLVLVALLTLPIGAVLQRLEPKKELATTVAAVLGAAALVWMIWPVLARRNGVEFWTLLLAGTLYVGWLSATLQLIRHKNISLIPIIFALGMGTGISALVGASALLGQLGMAFGATIGAIALLHLFTTKEHVNQSAILPLGITIGLIGFAAHLFAKVPMSALLLLALIPVTAWIPLPGIQNNRVKFVVQGLFAVTVSAIAIYFSWRSAGDIPF